MPFRVRIFPYRQLPSIPPNPCTEFKSSFILHHFHFSSLVFYLVKLGFVSRIFCFNKQISLIYYMQLRIHNNRA